MPLGRDAELDPGDIVLDGDPAPPERDTAAPPVVFGSCLLRPNDRPSQLLLSTCSVWLSVRLTVSAMR